MLYLCATPIGNLEDITLRVLSTLRAADEIWAEDTRHTLTLLNHFGIKKPLVSCHEHNERARAAMLIEAIRAGRTIAYCSDAGMPGISDPGALLVRTCYAHNLPVSVLPGASAALSAAVLSGLPCDTFTFYGFLPREKKARKARMEQIKCSEHMILLYESPLRLPATLKELADALGHTRQAAVLRELTKRYEEVVRGTLLELSERYSAAPRGEIVITIEGCEKEAPEKTDETALDQALLSLIALGFSPRDAATAVSALLNVQKRVAYQRSLELKA